MPDARLAASGAASGAAAGAAAGPYGALIGAAAGALGGALSSPPPAPLPTTGATNKKADTYQVASIYPQLNISFAGGTQRTEGGSPSPSISAPSTQTAAASTGVGQVPANVTAALQNPNTVLLIVGAGLMVLILFLWKD